MVIIDPVSQKSAGFYVLIIPEVYEGLRPMDT